MAKIDLTQISAECKEKNWQVISTEYTNLDTPMTFECPEGHRIELPWKKVRSKFECPICTTNVFKLENTKVIPKKGKTRILALDQASHDCGWSIFDDKNLVSYGIHSLSDKEETIRINDLKHWLISMISSWRPDYIALEGIQYQDEVADQAKMGITVFQTLARLQGVLMDACFELKIPFEICPTNTWRAHCGVKGRYRADKKKSMQLLAKTWYDISVSNDEADAIGIGHFLADKLSKSSLIEDWE